MTLVGYFNALRELGGARRIVDDDVSNRLRRTDRKGLARRRRPLLRELTSRIGSGDIPDILDQLGVMHDPDAPKTGPRPIDVLLATVSGDPSRGALVREMIRTRLDNLKVVQGRPGAPLAYRQVSGADAIPLLLEPSAAEWTLWTCPTSMREVEPNVNFVMDPRDPSIDNAPPFARSPASDGQGTLTLVDEVEDEVTEAEQA